MTLLLRTLAQPSFVRSFGLSASVNIRSATAICAGRPSWNTPSIGTASLLPSAPNSRREYATLKDIQLRLKAIRNIGKITKSMKMIASTKLNRAQKSMEVGRVFGQTAQAVFSYIDPAQSAESTTAAQNDSAPKTPVAAGASEQKGSPSTGKKTLVIACSSDRGLCGAIHSSIAKIARKMAKQDPSNTSIVVLGDKAKAQICRDSRQNIVLSFNQIGKNIPTFADAAAIVKTIISATAGEGNTYDRVVILYNQFTSVISYQSIEMPVRTLPQLLTSSKLSLYEHSNSTMANLAEFHMACQLYWALVEGHASEMSAKRMAMENATKNSEEMVGTLTMRYNRTRQAVITNELVDIIVGASAL